MFEVLLGLALLVVSSLILFSLAATPFSLGASLIWISFLVVSSISFSSSSWYAYVLFLVYVGGLLVLFIYICMVSSNFEFSTGLKLWPFIILLGSIGLVDFSIEGPSRVLGYSTWDSGYLMVSDSGLPLFVGLVCLLLLVFLVVVRVVVTSGSMAVVVSSN
uniref:NADH dehydrogenase subunit 6 n=1 Tax=Pyramidella dolabrata TaxID=252582 RepID=Q6VAP4_9GAST|nr:NADH dehydrogenase subunit 6 [Pyramidella dolabrata]AAR21557.2 NADH dehydrogenase subunit 6 [Pyramidella dolabrata]